MNAHVAELQAAVKGQTLPWVAFPDRPEAWCVGVHDGRGYVMKVKPSFVSARFWNWTINTDSGMGLAHHAQSAVEALDAANAEYARFAAELHEAGAA